jgi:hypothetical protein
MRSSELHITVGVAPASVLSVSVDNQLIKAAILYGDKVSLCSPVASLMAQGGELRRTKTVAQLQHFTRLFLATGTPEKRFARDQIGALKRLAEDREFADSLGKSQLRQFAREIESTAARLVRNSGFQETLTAVDAGLLVLKRFPTYLGTRETVDQFCEEIFNAVLTGHTHPLFDDVSGHLIRAGVAAGHVVVPTAGSQRSKQIRLAESIFSRLPTLPNASMKDVIAIRKDLAAPLVRFRSAVIKFSAEIESAAWDPDFEFDAEQVFLREVEPSVLDIEEAWKTNKYLMKLAAHSNKEAVVSGSIAAVVMNQFAVPTAVTGMVGLGTAAIASALGAWRDWITERQAIQKNHLFFYHRLNDKLR